MNLNLIPDLVVFGDSKTKQLQLFQDSLLKAFSDGKTSWFESNISGEIKVRTFEHPLEAFHEILEIGKKEKLYLVCALSYEFGNLFENIETPLNADYPFPLYSILAYSDEIRGDLKDQFVAEIFNPTNSELESTLNIFELENYSGWEKSIYLDAVREIKDLIRNGESYQINLSQNFTLPFNGSELDFFKKLVTFHPAPYSCFIRLNSRQLGLTSTVVSNSPELFLKREAFKIITRPIKGTRMRGVTAAEDSKLKEELLKSEKDHAELSMIVDLERNDLGRISEIGSVNVVNHAFHEGYSNVHHLVSEVEATLLPNLDILDILRRTFPCGSISGAPKIASQKIIASLEKTKRNIFTGSLGVVEPNGDFRLNVAIRTGVITHDNLYFNAGGGIVFDSDPEKEYAETLTKARAFYQTWLQTKS